MAAQLAVGILAGEFPFDSSSCGVPLLLPLRDFRLQEFLCADASSGALPVHDPDFDLGHIQPTGMFGRVVELHPLQHCCRRRLTQHIHEGFSEMY